MGTSKERDFDENRADYWNRAFRQWSGKIDQGQIWLEAHGDILIPPSHILDMGCGAGFTTEYLISRGHTVVATDISETALTKLRSRVPMAETSALDFTLGLPWKTEAFDHVVADLCLHYFDIDTTKRVVKEIVRVLKNGGYLLARVNSVRDTAHGSGDGTLVQPNYFLRDGHYKRFFDYESINDFFNPFELVRINEGCTKSYRGEKHLYEIIARKRNP